MSELRFLDGRVTARMGNIAMQEVEAIVNAANATLMGGGGVDRVIHAAAGPDVLRQGSEIRETLYPRGLPIGEAVLTTGGNLAAKYIIHTVGPIYGRNPAEETDLLASAYDNSLKLAIATGIRTIAFPAISTGAYRFPPELASGIASMTIEAFLLSDSTLKEVRLVFLGESDLRVFKNTHKFSH
jgi:O-acetyl-ADP-ribose deacetylase (regulator of RNase III)